jgi:hypothetical protein
MEHLHKDTSAQVGIFVMSPRTYVHGRNLARQRVLRHQVRTPSNAGALLFVASRCSGQNCHNCPGD